MVNHARDRRLTVDEALTHWQLAGGASASKASARAGIERTLALGPEGLFSPSAIHRLFETKAETIAADPRNTRRHLYSVADEEGE